MLEEPPPPINGIRICGNEGVPVLGEAELAGGVVVVVVLVADPELVLDFPVDPAPPLPLEPGVVDGTVVVGAGSEGTLGSDNPGRFVALATLLRIVGKSESRSDESDDSVTRLVSTTVSSPLAPFEVVTSAVSAACDAGLAPVHRSTAPTDEVAGAGALLGAAGGVDATAACRWRRSGHADAAYVFPTACLCTTGDV
jgi:hypothetical protein